MSSYNEVRALEIAIIDLVTAIQKDRVRLFDNEIEAVSDATKRVPNWKLEIHEGGK